MYFIAMWTQKFSILSFHSFLRYHYFVTLFIIQIYYEAIYFTGYADSNLRSLSNTEWATWFPNLMRHF